MAEINYNALTTMKNPYPEIRKLGACSPSGEMTPFVWDGRLMRMELYDPMMGTNLSAPVCACIRDVESGKIISTLADDSYYHSAYVEDDVVYVLGVDIKSRDTIRIYESRDLKNWTNNVLLSNPGWRYYNTALTKGPDGYVLIVEAGEPKEHVGKYPFTLFFATSPDMKNWTFMDYDKGFSKERYMGGPWMKYVDGWYYVISVTELPCKHYTNYIYRTKDFNDWYVGYYNPILMPDNRDRLISPHVADIPQERLEAIKTTGFNISNSDIDMCDWNGKVYMNYLCGNQLGFYYMCEAECDGTVADFLKSYFE
jgi:hypothetical protein